jgi:hypothetical protein
MGLGGRLIPRLAALATMWLVLDTLGAQLATEHSWAVWSILGLTVILEFLAYQHGVVQGIQIYRSMTPEQRNNIDRIIKESGGE